MTKLKLGAIPDDKPVVSRPDVSWLDQAYDALELGPALARNLRGLLWTGDEAISYVDAQGPAGAYQPVVEYQIDNREVGLTLRIERDGTPLIIIEDVASRDALGELAMDLAVRILEEVAALASSAP